MRTSSDLMTGPSMTRIHAKAQDNFIKSKWDTALSDIINYCNKKSDLVGCLKKSDIEKLSKSVVQTMIDRLGTVFGLEGFNPLTASPIINEMLNPTSYEKNSTARSALLQGSGLLVGIVGGLALGPFAAFAALSSVSLTATVAYKLSASNAIVLSCLEIAFVLERIFWFGTNQVREKDVTAAALYYLKRRNEVIGAGWKDLSMFDNIKEMKPALSKLVERFRYERQSIVELDEVDEKAMEARSG